MKKIVQTVSFLALAFIFGGVSAQAQTVTKIDADIPFDFFVGDRAFAAGKYVLRVISHSTSARAVVISDEENTFAYTVLASQNGDIGKGKAGLFFEQVGGQATLAKILTTNSGYSLKTGGNNRFLASNQKKEGDLKN